MGKGFLGSGGFSGSWGSLDLLNRVLRSIARSLVLVESSKPGGNPLLGKNSNNVSIFWLTKASSLVFLITRSPWE